MRRGDALIRDIARLFVKYGTNDWAVVVQLLRTGGPEYTQIAQAIESILATTKSVRDRRSTNLPKLPKPELTISFSEGIDPERVKLLGRFTKIYHELQAQSSPNSVIFTSGRAENKNYQKKRRTREDIGIVYGQSLF